MDTPSRRSGSPQESGSGPPVSPPSSRFRARTGSSLVAHALGHRVELAALDAEEARAESCLIALQAGLGLGVACVAGLMFNFVLAALVWDLPARVAWLALFFVLEAGLALLVLGLAWRRLQRWRPFAGFIKQLKADYACWNDSP
ncbi:hypothetical protein OpiT1DRAFT_04226 [Opitutaceae bacterium TAV1]|nr:hypothetical protein OpiT1DRAFT_04226 [Opitutaceae bacterium TAV1]